MGWIIAWLVILTLIVLFKSTPSCNCSSEIEELKERIDEFELDERGCTCSSEIEDLEARIEALEDGSDDIYNSDDRT